MNEKDFITILESLAVRIRGLESEITVKNYEIASLKAKNGELKETIEMNYKPKEVVKNA